MFVIKVLSFKNRLVKVTKYFKSIYLIISYNRSDISKTTNFTQNIFSI